MNWLGKTIKRQDAFGTPITVNYKGDSTYKSIFGGVVTLLIFTVILV